MVLNCCVPSCKVLFKKSSGIKFHSFPLDRQLKKIWLIKLRIGKNVGAHARVCSNHFTEIDYRLNIIGDNYVLKKGSVPSANLPTRPHDKIKNPRKESSYFKNKELQNNIEIDSACQSTPIDCRPEIIFVSDDIQYEEEIYSQDTDLVDYLAIETQKKDVQCQTHIYQDQLLSFCKFDESKLLYFTGLTRAKFDLILGLITEHNSIEPQTACSIHDQLAILLIKYRHNLKMRMLAELFGIDRQNISKIISNLTIALYDVLKRIDFWENEYVRGDANHVIIGCTEFPTEKSSNPEHHQLSFSHYENCTTFIKCLVGADENGQVIFVSPVYGGSISDREIFIKSKIIEKLKRNDVIFTDCGFEISDLLEEKGIVNISSFNRRRKQLVEQEDSETRCIDKRRIIVERVIKTAKNNNILTEVIPTHLWKLTNKIVYNCFMLVNFQASLVKHINK